MGRQILKYLLYTVVWLALVAYVVYASRSARSHRQNQRVERVEIEIVDSSASNKLVTTPMVEKWISQSKVRTLGESIDSVQLIALESFIEANGFVNQATAYTTYSGALRIKVSQLRPSLRILLDGYNSYITSDGYIFQTPPSSSRYVQVVTGNYKPLFTAGYSGNINEVYASQIEELESDIKRIRVKEVYPLYEEQIKNRAELKVVNSRYTGKRLGESSKAYDKRVAALKERNSRERAIFTAKGREIDAKIAKVEQKQNLYREKQKKLEKRYKDFINLITFVEILEKDKFWGSEIVQLVAKESSSGDLLLELIPRSGDHTIIFGQIEDVEQKLSNAKSLYKEVLPNEGWSKFKSINVEYKNQVVCK